MAGGEPIVVSKVLNTAELKSKSRMCVCVCRVKGDGGMSILLQCRLQEGGKSKRRVEKSGCDLSTVHVHKNVD